MQVIPILFGTPEFDDAVRLRYAVLRKPLGLEFSAEQLAEEYAQYHLAAYSDAFELIGYLNLTPLDTAVIKMRQVAIDPRWQGRGVGTELVRTSEQFAWKAGFNKITLHARETAVPFYLRMGYAIQGDRFEEVSIPHFRMDKEIGY